MGDSWCQIVVADRDNYRVQVFTLNGAFVRKWDIVGSGSQELGKPCAVALRGDTVLVSDYSEACVYVFRLDGTYLCRWRLEGCPSFFYGLVVTVAINDQVVVCGEYNRYVQVYE